MPLLIAWFGTAFSAIATWLVARVGFNTAVYAVYIAAIIAASLALYAAASAAVAPLLNFVPPYLSAVASWCLPTNIVACVAARLGVEVACASYNLIIRQVGALGRGVQPATPFGGAGPFGNQ